MPKKPAVIAEPFLAVNFKTYPSGTGMNALKTAAICRQVASKTGKSVIIAAQAADIYRISKIGISVFAQHMDGVLPGKNTGFVTAESIRDAGASGSLINHAEHKLSIGLVKQAVERASANNLVTIACAASSDEAREIAANCTPDYIAIEPPELISGNISISKAKPEIITGTIRAVQEVKDIPVICGAGVNSREDVESALRLGARGVLVANFVMSAADKRKAISELVSGLEQG
ncbi:triose-phosphate isomerase [Candidatus Woesearchaeota archaeon]|nr:triose-phosphate isomerase [Candidatus Woesearchaeota archaeon]